ncbi:MAG: BamA/TamA family outer membrane protein [Reichenbachiella sp.]
MGRRYLVDDQTLLVDQQLLGSKGLDKDELISLYDNKPNDKILFIPWSPYVDVYQIGLKTFDTTKYEAKKVKHRKKHNAKISKSVKKEKEKKEKKHREKLAKKIDKQNKNIKEGNKAMRLGEPLAIFDTTKENTTIENIKDYLHAKGYFNAEVSYEYEETLKLITSTYTIERNQPYKIDSIFYVVGDSIINQLLVMDHPNALIVKDKNYEQKALTNERDRINTLMLNNGYYNFNRQYVSFVVDSAALGDKKVIVGIKVLNPINAEKHKIFTIDSVIFTTDADVRGLSTERKYNEYNKVTYQFYSRRYSEKILDWRMFLNQDSIYRRSNTFETQKQLSNMDMFKFINISYDTTGGKFISNIFTSPLNKYQTSTELGLNVSQGLPGPFFNASIKNRNTFKGLEITELSGRIGFEGLSGARETGNPYSSLDYGINLAITFPQFVVPLGSEIKGDLGHLNPKTRISGGLIYNNRIEDYVRRNIYASWSYLWQNFEKRRSYTFTITDINMIYSDVTHDYQNFLDTLASQGNNLAKSFEPSFVNSMWFSAVHNINDYGNKKKSSAYFRYMIESGGNLLYSLKNVPSIESDSIEFFRFARFNIDYRKTRPVNSQITMAYRANLGVAIPYGENRTLPYEKFYFAGGSNSIRAWEPRRLGPGSFLPVVDGVYTNSFEQPAEILLETSVEFRHKLFGPIYGAFFLDAGNSWTIYADDTRPGADFKFTEFYKQIAVGGGYGIRLDLSFLILRLDAAWKIIDPGIYKTDDQTYQRGIFDVPNVDNYKRLVWNLGIGYPF